MGRWVSGTWGTAGTFSFLVARARKQASCSSVGASRLKSICCVVCVNSVAQLCLTLCDPMDYRTPGSSVHGFPGKNTGVGCHFHLQEIFLNQGLNRCLLSLLHWQTKFLTTSTTWERLAKLMQSVPAFSGLELRNSYCVSINTSTVTSFLIFRKCRT